MRCFECDYQCTPYDHGNKGGPTWTCERCHWSCKVNDEPRAVGQWQQAMRMQICVDEQLAYDDS